MRECLKWSVLLALTLALSACGEAQPAGGLKPSDEPNPLCTACHGDPSRASTAVNPQLAAAPPVDVLQESSTTAMGVGAHQAHLNDGALRVAIACTECHVVPGSLANHPNGVVNLTWGPLATSDGATPAFSNGMCSSTYCHGATLNAGGTNQAPSWTGGPSEAACGTCHGLPPPASSGHPQNPNCGSCHPGYTSSSVNPATHVNGMVDLGALGCSACHGDPTRQATALNPELAAAPPLDPIGESATTAPGVGAHQTHLTDGALRGALACTECHVVPTSLAHATEPLNLTWGPLATAAGATPTWDATSYTCTNYCHGATLRGGTNNTPLWTKVDGSQDACGTCHGLPPLALPSTSHPSYVLPIAPCAGCHPATATVDASGGNAIVAGGAHLNGTVEFTFPGHPAGWVDPTLQVECPNEVQFGGLHTCGGDMTDFLPGQCTNCHGNGSDFTEDGGSSHVSCADCHLNAFASTTCTGLGATAPCSCDLCHGQVQVVIPSIRTASAR